MDHARYVIALSFIITFPPAFLYWILVHSFIEFWRMLGTAKTFLIVLPIILLASGTLFMLRGRILAIDYGMNVLCMALGLVLLVLASVLDIQIKKYLKLRILVGIPELSAGDENPKLLTEGIYARTRNPRYLAVCITVCGWALMTNFLAMYVLCPILFGLVWIVVLLEEKELRNRFGEAYEEYLRKVPRFIPNF